MRPGILLDRDGTIIHDYHYVGHVERVQLIPGAADAIARFNRASIPVAIVTNQSGVARGFYPENNVKLVHDYITKELALHQAHIDLFLYSPHHPDGTVREYIYDSSYHKPHPGMAYHAAMSLDLDLRSSVVVGDRVEDVRFAWSVGAHAVYIGTEPIPSIYYANNRTVSFPSLASAAGYIIERLTGMKQPEFPAVSYPNMLSYFNDYSLEIRDVLDKITLRPISDAADILVKAHNDGSAIFIAGNGGAAALANHMETDHVLRMGLSNGTSGWYSGWYTNVRSLTGNSSLMTSAANDIGYDSVFSWQLERYATQHDVLVCFSVSGRSANIIRALQCATELNIRTIAVVACDGGKAAGLAEVAVHIPTSNYGIAEDVMSMVMHSIAQFIQQSRMSEQAIQSARF
jgi:histidinol-phosphate phosphatase family protein